MLIVEILFHLFYIKEGAKPIPKTHNCTLNP